MSDIVIRRATRDDVPVILEFIGELAEYEHMSDQVVATPELLEEWIFERGRAEVLLAELAGKDRGLCPVLSQFFDLPRAGRYLSGRSVRTAGGAGAGNWQGPAAGAGAHCAGTRMRTSGVGMSGLECPEHCLLSGTGSRSHGRMDDLASDGREPRHMAGE